MKFPIVAIFSPRAFLLAAVFALVSAGALAKESALSYLKDGQLEAATLLAPPPLAESAEAEADLNEVRAVYHAASSNDMAAAYSEKKFSVFNFAEAAGPFLVESNLPLTPCFLRKCRRTPKP